MASIELLLMLFLDSGERCLSSVDVGSPTTAGGGVGGGAGIPTRLSCLVHSRNFCMVGGVDRMKRTESRTPAHGSMLKATEEVRITASHLSECPLSLTSHLSPLTSHLSSSSCG